MAAKPKPINGLFMTSSSLTELPLPARRLIRAHDSPYFTSNLDCTSRWRHRESAQHRHNRRADALVRLGFGFRERGPIRVRQF
jgi:hypothetical protein